MKNLSVLFFLFISVFSFAQKSSTTSKKKTNTNKDTQLWIIDAQKAKCEGVTTSMCLLVKKPGDKDFNLFYDAIEGFEYEGGNEYKILVKRIAKTPPIPADASAYTYQLVKIVSKKKVEGFIQPTTNKPENTMQEENQQGFKMTTLVVNEEKAPCNGNPNAQCLLIKQEGKKTFEIFYQNIHGFTFEPGFRQTILVKERYVSNPMIKQTEPIYSLVKVIEKTKIFDVAQESTDSTKAKMPLDKKWILRVMKDTDTSSYDIEDNAVWIEFSSADNKLQGKAPCNNYFGNYTTDSISTFQAVAVGSTRMYCNNMKFEELFFSLLQNATNYKIENNRLSLYKGERLLLVFE